MSTSASPSIDNLALLWESVISLCEGLTDDEWSAPTGCPGWSVQDNVAHLVDYEASALGRARPDHEPADVSHTKNEMGVANEVGVDFRRPGAGADVLAELREVTAARLEQLRALGPDDLMQEMVTPAGPDTLAHMLRLRVMDTWSHEQDIRRAVGRPGDVTGPAATEAVVFLSRILPVAIGKKAGAPDGATVIVDVGDGLHHVAFAMQGGRASALDADPDDPTVTLRIPATTFGALTGGRDDVPADAEVRGDEALGRAILANLAFLP